MPSARARWIDFIPAGEEVTDEVAHNLIDAGRAVVDPLAMAAALSTPVRPAPVPIPVAGRGPPALHPKIVEEDPEILAKLKDGRAIVMRFPAAAMQEVAAAAIRSPTMTESRLGHEFRTGGAEFDVAYYLPAVDANSMIFVVASDDRPRQRVIVVP